MSAPEIAWDLDAEAASSDGEMFAAIIGAHVAVNAAGDREAVERSARLVAWGSPLTEWSDPMFMAVAS